MSAGKDLDPDDPIEAYLTNREKIRDPGTVRRDRNALSKFRTFLNEQELEPSDVTPDDSKLFFNWLLSHDTISRRTASELIAKVDKYYEYYNKRGYYEANPVSIAREELNTTTRRSKQIREVSVQEMRNIIQEIKHPLNLAIIVLLAKTGMRRGEVYNLDLRDLHIDDPRLDEILPSPRPAIKNKPDSIYVPYNVREGQVYNNEKREAGNKRERNTTIPIDDELKRTIIYWLAVRPPATSPAKPLFTTPEAQGSGQIYGDRIRYDNVYTRVRRVAERLDMWESPDHRGDQTVPNIRVHFFRHFFTTHMRNRAEDTLVRFIRGDVGDKAIDEYTHNWGQKVESQYRQKIFKLL